MADSSLVGKTFGKPIMPGKVKILLKQGVTRKILMLLFACGIFPMILQAGFFFYFYFNGQKQGIGEVQKEIGDRIATNISSYLEKTSGQIKLFARTLQLRDHNAQELKDHSYELLDQITEFDKITIADLSGKEISKVSRYYTYRPFELINISPEKSFQNARDGNTYFGKIEISSLSKFPHICISVPITDVRDSITGVLTVCVNVLKMWDYISRNSIGENRYAYIVDSEGFLIAYQDLSSVLQKRDLRNIEGIRNLLQGNIGVFEYHGLIGKQVIGANAYIPLTGWGVVVETAAEDAYRTLYLLMMIVLTIFLLTMLTALFLGFRFSFKNLIEPINLLQKEAEMIARGEFGDTIHIKSVDEIGQLADAFNVMTRNLNKTTVSRDLLIQEISERQKTEEALKKSEATLKSIFRVAPIGIGLVAERVFLWVNDQLCSMSGYDREEIVGRSARLLYPSQEEFDRVGLKKYDQIRNLGTGVIETRWKHKDGRIIDVLLSSTPLDPTDFSSGVTFTALDITERKKAETALLASAEIVRSIPSGLFVYRFESPDRLILLDGNPASEKLTGINLKECRGKEFNEIWPNARNKGIFQAFIQVMKTGRQLTTIDLDYQDNRLQGAFRTSVFLMPGERLGVAFENITEQKKAEQERQKLEDQLRQAYKMEAVGTMAGGIAHEFNNILGIILGNAELAIDDVPEWNPAKHCLEEIQKASLRGRDVVRQILSFARITPVTRKPIRISTVIQESLKFVRATIPSSIDIRQNILCDTETILGNSTEINKIFINLCSNSAHAIDQETGTISINLETVFLTEDSVKQYEGLAPGKYVRLSVKDTGKGIRPEILGRIFDPYFTTKDVDKGLGMGLAVVYGLVKKHDGAIQFVSEVGKGTTAEVLFPTTEEQPEIQTFEPEDLPGGNERIMIVDDEESLVAMVSEMLERKGYEVVGKTSSFEALTLFRKEYDAFDLIITDMAMPEMTGERLTQELLMIRPDIPVILCTGYSERISEEKAKEIGITAYTMKPLRQSVLLKTVREVLDEAKSRIQEQGWT